MTTSNVTLRVRKATASSLAPRSAESVLNWPSCFTRAASGRRGSPGEVDDAGCGRRLQHLTTRWRWRGRGGGGEEGGWVGREVGRTRGCILSVLCLILSLGVTSALVMCALFSKTSFAHGAQQFKIFDAELKHKWGVGKGPGADIPVWLGEFGKFTNELDCGGSI